MLAGLPAPGATRDGCPVFRGSRDGTRRAARRPHGLGSLGCAAGGVRPPDGRMHERRASALPRRRRVGPRRPRGARPRLRGARVAAAPGSRPRRSARSSASRPPVTIGSSASSSIRPQRSGTTRCSSSACSGCARRARRRGRVARSRSADRSTERGPDPTTGPMAQKFPRDRFDSIPHGIERVGAHRAPARRGAGGWRSGGPPWRPSCSSPSGSAPWWCSTTG